MQTIHLRDTHDVAAWAGDFARPDWYRRVITGEAQVLKPDGSPLLVILRHALPAVLYAAAYAATAPLARSAPRHNRGLAAGKIQPHDDPTLFRGGVARGSTIGVKSGVRYRPVKKDGTLSKTVYARDTASFVMGYSERSARFPYCRQTAYTAQHPARTRQLLPVLHYLSTLFAAVLPERYAAQHACTTQTSPDFYFPGSVFTTVTVNRNWQTALHTDQGDLAAGFGVMVCLRSGHYSGGLYVMPGFDVAVDLAAGDVLFSDVHEWHGNTALVGDPATYERITLVCYYRARMRECGSAAAELARVKRHGTRALHVS